MKVYRLWDIRKKEYVTTRRNAPGIWRHLSTVKALRTYRGKDRFEVHTFILVRDTFRVILESVLGTEYNDLAKEILDA